MNRTLALFCSLSLFATTDGVAAEPNSPAPWYIGGGISANNVFAVEGFGRAESSERGNSDAGFVLVGGYSWNRYVDFEINYIEGGSPTFNTLISEACPGTPPCFIDVVQETKAVSAGIVGSLPFARIWEVYIKGGAAFWDASSVQVFSPLDQAPSTESRIDRSGTDFMLAVGVGLMVGDRSRLRLEYQAFRTDDRLLNVDSGREARFDLVALALHWFF